MLTESDKTLLSKILGKRSSVENIRTKSDMDWAFARAYRTLFDEPAFLAGGCDRTMDDIKNAVRTGKKLPGKHIVPGVRRPI